MTHSNPITRFAALVSTVSLSTLSVLAIAPINPAHANASTYPPNFASAFLNGCKNSARTNAERLGLEPGQIDEYCNCSLQEIQSRYTFTELQNQQSSVDLFSITCDCAKESGIGAVVAQCGQ